MYRMIQLDFQSRIKKIDSTQKPPSPSNSRTAALITATTFYCYFL